MRAPFFLVGLGLLPTWKERERGGNEVKIKAINIQASSIAMIAWRRRDDCAEGDGGEGGEESLVESGRAAWWKKELG